MMPVIRINDATFADIKAMSAWYGTKTPSTTIERVVQEMMNELGMEREVSGAVETPADDGILTFNETPGLSFTKPLKAMVDGKRIKNPRWASILIAMIEALFLRNLDAEDTIEALAISARQGKYEDDGFKFYDALGFSVQGQSAQGAWKEIERIADAWDIPVSVEFWWRKNSKAQNPGRTGILTAGGE